jgi:hypothetical protein
LLIALTVLSACGGGSSSSPGTHADIYVRYVGNSAGVYDGFCTAVSEEPPGRIVEIDRPRDVIVIDATYEYLPDGLKFTDSSSPIAFADCHDYDLKPVEPVPPPTALPGADSSTSAPPASSAP